jgi:hypothetical protein
MPYTHGTFLIYPAAEIENLKSVDDLFQLLVDENASAAVPEIDKLVGLAVILTGSTQNCFVPVEQKISETSALFLVAKTFRDMLADADRDRLTDVTSAWVESDSWKDTEINSFDLFCLLLGLNSLSQKARDTAKELYLLLSSDADLLPT